MGLIIIFVSLLGFTVTAMNVKNVSDKPLQKTEEIIVWNGCFVKEGYAKDLPRTVKKGDTCVDSRINE